MPDQQQLAADIARLEALLSSGATKVVSDGEEVDFDPVAARQRLAELKAQQTGQRHLARQVRTLDLRNAF